MLCQKPPDKDKLKVIQPQFFKNNAKTPGTAQSAFLQVSQKDVYHEAHQSFTLTPTVKTPNKKENEKNVNLNTSEISSIFKTSEKCKFQIGLQLWPQNEQIVEFQKPIENWKEEKDICSLIFERQYEKKKFILETKYIVKVHIVDEDGFSKEVCEMNFCLSDNSKKSNGKISEKNFSIFYEIQNYNTAFIKMLAISMPTQTIDQFYSFKYSLINQSPSLNKVNFLKELKGIFKILSQQNMGSRILQKLIQRSSQKEINFLVEELKPSFCELASDKYGNYVIQKIFLWSPQPQRKKYLQLMKNNFRDLLKTKTGTHTLQTIITSLDIDGVRQVYNMIEGHEFQLCNDEFGTYFIQKLFEICLNYDMVTRILTNFRQIAINKYGLVVLKKIMSFSLVDSSIKFYTLQYCEMYFKQICDTEYGHYIVEELFQYYPENQLSKILNFLSEDIIELSLSIYSSSIIKKSLEVCGQNLMANMIEIIIKGNRIIDMMESNPGSFVLHRLLERSKGSSYEKYLVNQLKKNYEELNKYQKKMKWKNFLQK